MSNCKDKIGHTCSKRVNSRCVDYEGEVSECSELDSECRIHTVHEVLEDSSRQLTKICSELDLSEVDKGCLEIEGDSPKVKDFIQSIVNKVCDPQAGCDEIFNTTLECSGLDYKCFVDECSEEFSPQNLKQLFQMLIDRSCEGSSGGGSVIYHTTTDYYPNYLDETGYPLLSGSATMIGANTSTKVGDLDMTGLVAGNYLLEFEAVVDGGGNSENGRNFNYELRLDNSSIQNSTRVFRIKAGTPADEYSHIGVKVPVSVTSSSQILTVWINNFDSEVGIAVAGGSLTATKM